MLMDRDYELDIQRISKLVNVDRELAIKIYKECGTNIDKIYLFLKKLKVQPMGHYTHCLRCGKLLKSKESRVIGYGKVCLSKKEQHRMNKLNLVDGAYAECRTTKSG